MASDATQPFLIPGPCVAAGLAILFCLPCLAVQSGGSDRRRDDTQVKVNEQIDGLSSETRSALDQLHRFGAPALVYIAAAIRSRDDLSPLNRLLLIGVIDQTGDEQGDVALLSLLIANDPLVRGSAAAALGRRKYKCAIPQLVKLLGDKETYLTVSRTDPYRDEPLLVRDAATEALESIAGVTLAKKGRRDEKAKAWQRWWERQQSSSNPKPKA